MVLLLKVKPAGSSEVVTVELVLVMTTLSMAVPAHTVCSRFVALRVTVGLTVRLKVISSGSQAGVWLLVAVMTISYSPAVVGVPEMVLLLNVKPSGRVEVVTVELALVMTTLLMAVPAHTVCSRFVALRVTVGLTVSLKVSFLAKQSVSALLAMMTIS